MATPCDWWRGSPTTRPTSSCSWGSVEYHFRHETGLTIVTEYGPDVMFGDSSEYEFKLASWEAVLRQTPPEDLADAVEIDVRFGPYLVLR